MERPAISEACWFATARLTVAGWHRDRDRNARLERDVVRLLSPGVTAPLPPSWQGEFDEQRAARWIAERDDESTTLSLVDRTSGTVVGLLILDSQDMGPTGSGVEIRVGYLIEEAAWGRGHASELIAGLIGWARGRRNVTALVAGVAPDNPASVRVLAKNGFVAIGASEQGDTMFRLDLSAPDLVIRPEEQSDFAGIRGVVTGAFGSAVEGDLVERIRASAEYVPQWAMVAELDGVVVGHVMVGMAVVRSPEGDRPIAMLSPLAVAADQQRRGIGAALVRAVSALVDAAGEPIIVLEGNPAYYGRFGFEHATGHGLTIPLPDWAPSEAGQVLLLTEYDRDDTSLRGSVMYPAAFDGVD